MANGATHSVAGGLCGLVVALMEQDKEKPINPLLAVGTGTIFAKLPDILEPATNPHHRQFCHSLVVLASVGISVKQAFDWKPEDSVGEFWRAIALCAGAAYISHLLLDGITPRSLPLVGKL